MQQLPGFIQWIYGEGGIPPQVNAGRLQAWAQAFEAWLEGSTSTAQKNMRLCAWRDFLQYLGKPPWQASTADVDAWMEAERRAGSSENWLWVRLRHLASFYNYCQETGVDPACAGKGALLQHPVRGAKKPKHERYGDLNYLSLEETRALMGMLREDVSPLGRRDYALFVLLLESGRRVSVTSRLRWADVLWGDDGLVFLRWPGSAEPVEMPILAWGALWKFLRASGRLDAMQPDWTLFPPLSPQSALRILKREPGEWANTHPLKQKSLIYLLKQYARWAGLQTDKVNFSTIRHTAAYRMAERGMSCAEMCKRLGLTCPKNFKAYLRELRAYPKVELWSPDGPQPHQPRGEGEYWLRGGQHPALKHGIYASHLPESWLEDLYEQMPELRRVDPEQDPYLWEIGLETLRCKKVAELGMQAQTLDELLRYTDLIGLRAIRKSKALRKRQQLQKEIREGRK